MIGIDVEDLDIITDPNLRVTATVFRNNNWLGFHLENAQHRKNHGVVMEHPQLWNNPDLDRIEWEVIPYTEVMADQMCVPKAVEML